jgi:hypothetical protein
MGRQGRCHDGEGAPGGCAASDGRIVSEDATRLFQELNEFLPRPTEPPVTRSLHETLCDVERIASDANKIAANLIRHIKGAPAEYVGFLLRLERVCGDFRLGVAHALNDLSPSVRARLADL